MCLSEFFLQAYPDDYITTELHLQLCCNIFCAIRKEFYFQSLWLFDKGCALFGLWVNDSRLFLCFVLTDGVLVMPRVCSGSLLVEEGNVACLKLFSLLRMAWALYRYPELLRVWGLAVSLGMKFLDVGLECFWSCADSGSKFVHQIVVVVEVMLRIEYAAEDFAAAKEVV